MGAGPRSCGAWPVRLACCLVLMALPSSRWETPRCAHESRFGCCMLVMCVPAQYLEQHCTAICRCLRRCLGRGKWRHVQKDNMIGQLSSVNIPWLLSALVSCTMAMRCLLAAPEALGFADRHAHMHTLSSDRCYWTVVTLTMLFEAVVAHMCIVYVG